MSYSLELSFFDHFFPQGKGATLYVNSIKQNLYYHNWNFIVRFFSSFQFEFLTTEPSLHCI